MTEAVKKTILIVDDHPVFRHGLIALVGAEPDLEVIGDATSLEDAKAKLETLKPDAIVVDLALGDSSGLELVRHIEAAVVESSQNYTASLECFGEAKKLMNAALDPVDPLNINDIEPPREQARLARTMRMRMRMRAAQT